MANAQLFKSYKTQISPIANLVFSENAPAGGTSARASGQFDATHWDGQSKPRVFRGIIWAG